MITHAGKVKGLKFMTGASTYMSVIEEQIKSAISIWNNNCDIKTRRKKIMEKI